MESVYEFDSLSELPPLPQIYDRMEYSTSFTSESLPPFPYSDFTTYGDFTFSDHHQNLLHPKQHGAESFFLDESNRLDNHDTPFLHMPNLQSVEDTKQQFLSLAPPPPDHDVDVKRHRLRSPVKTSSFNISPFTSSKSKPPVSSSSYGAGRRKIISDKIRSLEKLMPWENKMNLAMILQETHKYITFLQSQIASLRWMPLESAYPTKPGESKTSVLKSLTRQQILQVIANSPGSRNVLYTMGVCIFSYEQLLSVQMMAESARNL